MMFGRILKHDGVDPDVERARVQNFWPRIGAASLKGVASRYHHVDVEPLTASRDVAVESHCSLALGPAARFC